MSDQHDNRDQIRDNTIAQIAKGCLKIETLNTRNSDRLDFHEVPVWDLKQALQLAYKAGEEPWKCGDCGTDLKTAAMPHHDHCPGETTGETTVSLTITEAEVKALREVVAWTCVAYRGHFLHRPNINNAPQKVIEAIADKLGIPERERQP